MRNRNKFVVPLVVVALFVGLVIVDQNFKSTNATAVSSSSDQLYNADTTYQQITGTADMAPEPQVYTTLIVPPNYASDPKSIDLLRGFDSNPTLVALRDNTKFTKYTSDNQDFQHRFGAAMPQVSQQGQTGVLITAGDQKILCKYGRSSKEIADEVKGSGLLRRLRPDQNRPCPSCPKPSPSPSVKPVSPPSTPVITETPAITETVTTEDGEVNNGLVALTLLGATGLVYAAFFRYRMG